MQTYCIYIVYSYYIWTVAIISNELKKLNSNIKKKLNFNTHLKTQSQRRNLLKILYSPAAELTRNTKNEVKYYNLVFNKTVCVGVYNTENKEYWTSVFNFYVPIYM